MSRPLVAVVTGLALVLASVSQQAAFAQGSGASAPAQVGGLFNSYPAGGPGLKLAIKNLVLSDPTSASEVVRIIKTANLADAQREAAEQGLAEALNQLLLRGEDVGGFALNPMTIAALSVLAAALGVGIYQATKDKKDPVVSPN